MLVLPHIEVERRAEGGVVLRARPAAAGRELGFVAQLRLNLERCPDRPAFLEKSPTGAWSAITHATLAGRASAVAEWLRDQPPGPVMVLGANGIEHAVLLCAALLARRPVTSLTPAYSTSPEGLERVRHAAGLLRPAVAFAHGTEHREALALVQETTGAKWCQPTGAVARWSAGREAEDAEVARIMFTSGTTGTPKAIPVTHGMLRAAAAASLGTRPEGPQPPVLVDWLPWAHAAGAMRTFHNTLLRGGTLYVDDGSPTTTGIRRTVENLRELQPTEYFNIPAGLAQIAGALEADESFARGFLARIELLLCGGGIFTPQLAQRWQCLARRHRGRPLPLVNGWGSTETTAAVTLVSWETHEAASIGLPVPGHEVKLAPCEGRFELRVRGPMVMGGYLQQAAPAPFDDEGFLRTGDAGRLVDAADPLQGIAYEGRLADDFKLSSGTWVRCQSLQERLAAALDVPAERVLLLGEGQDYIAAVYWDPADAESPLFRIPTAEEREATARALRALNATARGSSAAIRRVARLGSAPSAARGELTAKGTPNRAQFVAYRPELLRVLFAAQPSAAVVEG